MITVTEHLSGLGINENLVEGNEKTGKGVFLLISAPRFSPYSITLSSPPFVCGHPMCEQAQELLHHKIILLGNVEHGPGHKLVLIITHD